MDYINLHLHTVYSLYDGAMTAQALVSECKRERHHAVGITDHGMISGSIKLSKALIDHGIKPILGCEFYVASKLYSSCHLTVLAQNNVGWRNIVALHNLSCQPDRFYKKPRITLHDLSTHSEGLIVLSGCLGSLTAKLWADNKHKDAVNSLRWLRAVFGTRFFLEVQPHQTPEQIAYNDFLYYQSFDLKIPLVATSDSHHACGKDLEYLAMMNREHKDGPKDLSFGTVRQVSCLPPESIWKTAEIADSCDTPKLWSDKLYFPGCEQSEIDQMIEEARKFTAHAQLEYEIKVISDAGFMPYFVVLWKLKKWCDEQGILWGAGRGSVAGSLFANAIGITKVNPIRYGLYFERFLNPDRVSPPDIDVDIEDERRDEVLAYIKSQYGDCYAISTYTESGFKTAIRDASRALGYAPEQANVWAKLLPDASRGVDPTYDECISALHGNIPNDVLESTKALVGKLKSIGRHPGGTIIAPKDYPLPVPVLVSKGVEQIAYDMEDTEVAGLVKYDLLGLAALSIVKRLRVKYGNAMPVTQSFDDKMQYLIDHKKLNGIFQIGAGGIAEFTRKYKPRNVEEVSEVLALFRPGPLDSGIADEVLAIRSGKAKSDKPLFIYQEQIMQYARDHAGYTMAEADLLRKAIGKKKPEELAKHKDRFEPEIWELIEKFGAYSFNKAHSVAYAFLTHETLYWKAHYPADFYASLIETYADNPYRRVLAILQAKHDGITLELPKALENWHTTASDGIITLGMNTIKGLKKQPKALTKRHKNILEELSEANHKIQMTYLQCPIKALDIPRGHGLVCAKEKKTSLAGKIYWMLVVDTKDDAFEQYSSEDVEIGSLITIRRR